MADHNDPNAVNSIFSDVDVSAADLYDIFGFPSDDTQGGEKVVIALTFASIPHAGTLDPDMLYRIQIAPDERVPAAPKEHWDLQQLVSYLDGVKNKYASVLRTGEVRVRVDASNRAHIRFVNFHGGTFEALVETNKVLVVKSPAGHSIKTYIGGRDDAFFNDLPGFFRSINYAPQFYHVPHSATDLRECRIPKTLLELDGNDLFNYDPALPDWGRGYKKELPNRPFVWEGSTYKKDEKGNFRFVYSGKDAQAGKNINAIILEIPLAFLTPTPDRHRIVNTWGESWVLKAANKVELIPDDPFWLGNPLSFLHAEKLDDELKKYKLVDTDGQAFADAALSEREDERQMGANNFWLAPHFVKRLGHLGWGFGPSISALGLKTAFDHDGSPISVHKTYSLVAPAFARVKKLLFQELRMPDTAWNRHSLDIPLRRPMEVFIPNVNSIDMDTTGTWPFGRRPEDQVATRFLSLFLDMTAEINGVNYNVELLSQQWVWDASMIEPKTPPNPLRNDKDFSSEFPYLAEPW